MDQEPSPIDYDRPVAYDAEGQPLYAHPPVEQVQDDIKRRSNHKVWSNNSKEPSGISDASILKHNRSKKVFPELNLNEGDYVISAIPRHFIGLILPFALGILLISASFVLLFNYDLIVQTLELTGAAANFSIILLPVIIFVVLVLIGEYVAYYVYTNNRLFLTNESVIQEIQTGLFSRSEQIVSLGNIEDTSYAQNGIIQQIFNYGSIRLSTEGEETTYRFSYVANPKEHVATLNNAIENFKNFRPVC